MQEETADEVSQISGQTRAEHQYAERTVRVGRVNSKPLKQVSRATLWISAYGPLALAFLPRSLSGFARA